MDAATEINRIKHLPPLSATASCLIELLADEDVGLKQLASVIAQDPGLTARIIGLANSAYFAQPSRITSVEEAIIRVLGLNLVKSLALGIALAGAFKVDECEGFDLSDYWYRSLASAQLARELALHVLPEHRPEPDVVYLAGLFHNLGALLLAHVSGTQYSQVIKTMAEQPSSNRQQLEQEVMDTDSVISGQILASRWHLPSPVRIIMSQIGQHGYQGDYMLHGCLVNCAVEWVGRGSGDQYHLQEDERLLRIPGLEPEVIGAIVASFETKAEQLKIVAASLT